MRFHLRPFIIICRRFDTMMDIKCKSFNGLSGDFNYDPALHFRSEPIHLHREEEREMVERICIPTSCMTELTGKIRWETGDFTTRKRDDSKRGGNHRKCRDALLHSVYVNLLLTQLVRVQT